jgi:hypothetical protein
MKNSLLIIVFAISLNCFGQNRPYCFDQTITSYIPITGGSVLGNTSNDDNSFNNLAIGFTFNFKGTNFTQFCVNTNGYITLGSTSGVVSFSPVSGPSNNNVLSVLGTDLIAHTGSVLRYQTIGTAPNRTLVVQWLNYTPFDANSNLNFQLRLNETTNTIQFHYGSFTLEAGSDSFCEVGLRGSMSNELDFNNIEITSGVNTWSAPEILQSSLTATCDLIAPSEKPANGLRYTWSPSALVSVSNSSIFCLNSNLTLNATATSGTVNWYDSPSNNVILTTGPAYLLTNVVQSDTVYVAMNGCLTQRIPIAYNLAAPIPNQYNFSQNSSTYTAITTGTVLGNTSNDDEVFNNLPIGFNFKYSGITYTNFSAASNGFIRLGASVTNSFTPISSPDQDNIISPLGGDLEAQTGSTLRYSVSGVSPNRILTIQWQNYRLIGETGSYNFQIKLFETSNIVQFVYGTFTQPAGVFAFFEVGISGDPNTSSDFSARSASQGNNTWATSINAIDRNATFSEINENTYKPASGQRYIWTPIQFNSTNNPTVCAGQNANLIVTSSAGTVNWYDVPSGGSVLGTGLSFTTPTLTTSTTYYSQITGNNCPIVPRTPILVNVIPVTASISASGPLTFCNGGSVTLTSSSPTGNLWSNGATTQSVTITNGGTYTVTVSNGTCSATSSPTVVTVNPIPTTPIINTSGPLTFCSGGSVTLTSSSSTGNSWSNGATTQSITVSNSETFTVSVSNGACSASSTPTIVAVNPLPVTPTINLSGPLTFCTGGSVTLTSSSATSNLWSNGATTQSITVSDSGVFTVTVSNGTCSASSTPSIVTVNPIPPTPVVSASGPLTFCSGGSVTLTSSSATSNIWSNGAVTQSITVSNSGTYTLTVSNGSCSATSTPLNVIVNPLPLVNAGPDLTTCDGENIVLNATGAVTYNWSGGVSNGVPFTPTTGIYTVTGTDVNNCQNTDQMFVVVNSLPLVVASSIGNGVLSVSPGATYQWINCETGLQINGQVGQTFTPLANGSYAAIVSNGNCSDTSNCVVISTLGIVDISQTIFTFEPNPTVDFLTLTFNNVSGYIRILDNQGKEIDAFELNSGDKLDVTNYSPGIYIIQLNTSSGTSVGRFMKQ